MALSDVQKYINEVVVVPVTWASGATVSGEVDLGGLAIIGVYVPADFEGTALTMTKYIETPDAHATVTGWELTVASNQFAYVETLAQAQAGTIKLVSNVETAAQRVGEIHAAKVV